MNGKRTFQTKFVRRQALNLREVTAVAVKSTVTKIIQLIP